MLTNTTIKQVVEYRQQKDTISESDYRDILLNRCPNYEHVNGKIYASNINEPYVAVTVSPYHSRFESQIESGVFPLVSALLGKGYFPVSSCAGHTDHWREYYVTIAIPELIDLTLELSKDSKVEYFESMANIKLSVQNNGSMKYSRREFDEINTELDLEYRDLDMILMREYKKYYYAKISFDYSKYELRFNPFDMLAGRFFHKKEISKFNEWKSNIIEHIQSEEFPYFYA